MKRLIAILLTCLAASPALRATKALEQPFNVTVDGAYGRPFKSAGLSGLRAFSYGGAVNAEWRALPALSAGVEYAYQDILQDNHEHPFHSAGLDLRLHPFTMEFLEPYLSVGGGWLLSNPGVKDSVPGPHYTAGLGDRFGLGEHLAVDFALLYHYYSSTNANVSNIEGRLGLGYCFGAPAPAAEEKAAGQPAPTPLALSVKDYRGAGPDAKDKTLSMDLGGGSPLQVKTRAWALEMRDADGNLVKTFSGDGPVPKEFNLPMNGLEGKHLKYDLKLTGMDGKTQDALGELDVPKGAEAAAPEASVTTQTTVARRYTVKSGDTLWSIAGSDAGFGDSFLFPLLIDANPGLGSDPDMILPEQELAIPGNFSDEAKKAARARAEAWKER